MDSTMQDAPLLISSILRHGESVYADKKVFTVTPDGVEVATYFEISKRAERLAAALERLGIARGERVATFMWNNQRHMEAYYAVPSMGAVLHTLNIRLFPEQLIYVINHARDKIIVVDASLVPLLAKVRDQLPSVEHIIVAGEGDTTGLGETLDYETLLEAERPGYQWPVLNEREAAIMCYTSGTTGNPKGVVYSHRSTWLHSLASMSANSVGLCERDRCLLIVPMFHVNAWGAAFTAMFAGMELIMPQMFLQGEPILKMVRELRPTISLGVPTIWNDVLRAADAEPSSADLSSLRGILVGGSALPRVMIESFRERFGVNMIQGWGMTETSPLAAVSIPPAGTPPEQEIDYRVKAGRIVAGVEVRVTDDQGEVLVNDGKTVGEFEIRGPWITASYYGVDDPEKFHDGWLRTGDIGTLDALGYMVISDRTKDVIKSGGEWISSVELESTVMANPAVFEAAVIAVPDDKWQERPLCCVVLRPGASATANELRDFLAQHVAKWWLPERWSFVESIPKTSVGKFDKKVLRQRFADGQLDVVTVTP
ncbi:MAG TPA: long-chain fatty acid--CoA ligase [Acidimicrobiales bacterium]|nr:long-chain fatty acid--CoA ligase [Acidimicrobiales bacterium]